MTKREFGAYLEVDWVVNNSIDRLNQEGFHAPPVTFALLLLDSDKLAKVAIRFAAQPLDQ
jgi:hypothetical protein